FELRAHVRARAGIRDALPALPAWGSGGLGDAVRGTTGIWRGAYSGRRGVADCVADQARGTAAGMAEDEPKKLFAAMHADKKARGGKVRFVLAPRLGRASSYDDVPAKMVECVLRCAPECLQRPVVEIVNEATGKTCG